MKRSEMIEKLREYIDHHEESGYCVSPEYILDLIEEAGMLPPTRSNGLDGVAAIIEGNTTNTWEKE